MADGTRFTPKYQELYELRKEAIKWDFADAKNTRRVQYQVQKLNPGDELSEA